MNINPKYLILSGLVLLGIVAGVILVTYPQIFSTRAANTIYNSFQVTPAQDNKGKNVSCNENNCQTDTLDINFQVDPNALEQTFNH